MNPIPLIILSIYFVIGLILAVGFVAENKQRAQYFYSEVVAETCFLIIAWGLFAVMYAVKMLRGKNN